jgi:hypothetical protein
MRGDISYDLVMDDDMSFVEGTFRFGDDDWQVVIVSKKPVPEPTITPSAWSSGVKGIVIYVPKATVLNRQLVEGLMSREFGVDRWNEVRGPDSLKIR